MQISCSALHCSCTHCTFKRRSGKRWDARPATPIPSISGGAAGPGYLPANFGPFKVTANSGEIANTTNSTGQTRFTNRVKLLHSLDDNLRVNSPNGTPLQDYDDFYCAVRRTLESAGVEFSQER